MRLSGGKDALVSSPILELNLHEGLWGDGAHQHVSGFFEALERHQPSQLHPLLGNDGDGERATGVYVSVGKGRDEPAMCGLGTVDVTGKPIQSFGKPGVKSRL